MALGSNQKQARVGFECKESVCVCLGRAINVAWKLPTQGTQTLGKHYLAPPTIDALQVNKSFHRVESDRCSNATILHGRTQGLQKPMLSFQDQ